MHGRVVVPMNDDSNRLEFWKSSPIIQHPLLQRVDLVSSKDMVCIEDMNEASLPPTTDDATHVHQSEKHQQIGVAGALNEVASISVHVSKVRMRVCVCVLLQSVQVLLGVTFWSCLGNNVSMM